MFYPSVKTPLMMMMMLVIGTAWASEAPPGNSGSPTMQDLARQVHHLQQKLMQLEHKLAAGAPAGTSSGQMNMDGDAQADMSGMDMDKSGQMGMGMMGGMKMGGGMMGMGSKGKGMMGGMNMEDTSSGSMSMGGGQKGMGMMGMGGGQMGNTPALPKSALPGYPGASHIYHIGATGFFIDHADHLELTTEQRTNLHQIQEKTTLAQAEHQRAIDQAEQDLWKLTAVEAPDAQAIQEQIASIAEHQSKKRFEFIQAVGSAAAVLTEHQRHVLAGTAQSDQSGH